MMMTLYVGGDEDDDDAHRNDMDTKTWLYMLWQINTTDVCFWN